MSWFIVKVKLQIGLKVLWYFFQWVARGIQEVVKGTLAYSISRIYVPAPYLAVAETASGMLVVYPVDVGYSLLVTCSSPFAHILA